MLRVMFLLFACSIQLMPGFAFGEGTEPKMDTQMQKVLQECEKHLALQTSSFLHVRLHEPDTYGGKPILDIIENSLISLCKEAKRKADKKSVADFLTKLEIEGGIVGEKILQLKITTLAGKAKVVKIDLSATPEKVLACALFKANKFAPRDDCKAFPPQKH